MERITETLRIDGMSCGHCVAAVRSALAGLDGVEVEDVQIGEARVAYDRERVTPDVLAAAIEEEGFTVRQA